MTQRTQRLFVERDNADTLFELSQVDPVKRFGAHWNGQHTYGADGTGQSGTPARERRAGNAILVKAIFFVYPGGGL